MNRKNILVAALLPFVLLFCKAWAMDQPENPDRKEVCTTLQNIAGELRTTETRHDLEAGKTFRQQLVEQLRLLSNQLPYRKNKIDVLIKDLTKPIETSSNYGGILTQALKEICDEKKSIVEQAQDIRKQIPNLVEKLQRLEILYTNAQSKKPQSKQRLLLLLWEQDIKDLEAMRSEILSEQTKILAKDLSQKREISPLQKVVITISFLKEKNRLYNRALLESNISRLLQADEMLKKIDLPQEQLVLDCIVKVDYMLAILQMWQAFDEQNVDFDPYAFASTIVSIKAYAIADFLSKEDIAKIQELIKNTMFTNFIENGFHTLDQNTQDIVLEACKKIREKEGLENFPMPIKQVQPSSQPQTQVMPESKQSVQVQIYLLLRWKKNHQT